MWDAFERVEVDFCRCCCCCSPHLRRFFLFFVLFVVLFQWQFCCGVFCFVLFDAFGRGSRLSDRQAPTEVPGRTQLSTKRTDCVNAAYNLLRLNFQFITSYTHSYTSSDRAEKHFLIIKTKKKSKKKVKKQEHAPVEGQLIKNQLGNFFCSLFDFFQEL